VKISFVGHERHRRTGSARFMIELLRTIADVTEFYIDPDGAPDIYDATMRQLVASQFDRYVYWQTELISERLLPMDLGPSFLVPMYDTVADTRDDWWLRFINCHFLSFTRCHHERLRAMGCVSSHFQYFPDPGPERERRFDGDLDAFFWRRRPRSAVDLATVLRQCRELGIVRLHVHDAPDFAEDRDAPLPADDGAVEITVSQWFDRHQTYREIAGAPLFFFASRPREGIGMACLEAMANAQIVVSPDVAAVNEYVAHLSSGLLYGPASFDVALSQINAAALERMSRAARRKMVEGRRAWLADTARLLSIIAMDGRRWSMSDSSAGFGDTIRRAAHWRLNVGR